MHVVPVEWCVQENGGCWGRKVLGGEGKLREIHPVPFLLWLHYETLQLSERTDELQQVFHLKMGLMS